MEINVTLANLFQLFIAAQFSVYIVLTFRRQRLLPFTLFLVTLGLHMVANFLTDTQILTHDFDITFSFRFLYGPLLYLAVREIIKNTPDLTAKDLCHGIPFIIALPTASAYFIFDILGILSIAIYFFFTIRLVNRVKNLSADVVSAPGGGRIDWVQTTAFGVILISVFDITHTMGNKYFSVLNSPIYQQLTLIMLMFLLNWFAYKAIRYPEEFDGFTRSDMEQLEQEDEVSESLNDQEIELIDNAIAVLKDRNIYLDPNLRASDLADCVELKQRFISRALYLHTGMRFNTFVNSLRIDKAKQLISQAPNDRLNILAISFEAGFNSKTAFNTSFKTFTGMTPSDYKNSLK